MSSLAAMDVAGRVPRLRARFASLEIDALLVTNLRNVRYLSGFTGSAGLLLVRHDVVVLVTDGRYREQAGEQLRAAGVEAALDIGLSADAQRELLAARASDIGVLGLEADDVTWAAQRRYATEWFPGASLVPTERAVEELRAVKDPGEVARIEAAAAIADAALDEVRPMLDERATEAEVGLALDTAMRRLGASAPSFETIVASGPNGAKPHARPGERRIGRGELVVFDFGATVDGYRSDMTRTLWVGELDETQQRMYEVVKEAQAAGVAAVRPGVSGRDVDEACRSVIRDAGWGDAFIHGTGHGVGLDIHEDPRVSSVATATLAAGHVVTVEPGVYLGEHGGVRIEDTVVVTADGCRTLTRAPKA
jgi:Xaa-Pro aminopeptidase